MCFSDNNWMIVIVLVGVVAIRCASEALDTTTETPSGGNEYSTNSTMQSKSESSTSNATTLAGLTYFTTTAASEPDDPTATETNSTGYSATSPATEGLNDSNVSEFTKTTSPATTNESNSRPTTAATIQLNLLLNGTDPTAEIKPSSSGNLQTTSPSSQLPLSSGTATVKPQLTNTSSDNSMVKSNSTSVFQTSPKPTQTTVEYLLTGRTFAPVGNHTTDNVKNNFTMTSSSKASTLSVVDVTAVSLVVAVVCGVTLFIIALAFVSKRCFNSWGRKDYSNIEHFGFPAESVLR